MEPTKEQVNQWRIRAIVARTFKSGSRWFVQFEGSWESLCIGEDPPNFGEGDAVDIIIRRSDAQPS